MLHAGGVADDITLRPWGLGELLDRAVNFWRKHWRPLFVLVLGFRLVELTPMMIGQIIIRTYFPLARDPQAMKDAPLEALPQLLGSMGVLLTAMAVMLLVAHVTSVAVTHFAWGRLVGLDAPQPADAFRHCAQRLGPTVGSFLLSLGWGVGVFLLLSIPAAFTGWAAWSSVGDGRQGVAIGLLVASFLLLGLAAVVTALWFTLRFVLLTQILSIEPVGAWEAFRRSGQLSSGRIGPGPGGLVKVRLMVLITVVGGLLLILGAVTSIPVLIAGAIFRSDSPGLLDHVPLTVLIPLQFLEGVVGALFAPLGIVFQLFFYGDMRMRREGLDLELTLDRLP